MDWTSHQNTVLGPNGVTISFQFVVKKVLSVGDVVVVLLDVPADRSMPENVFGLALDGTRLWEVQLAPKNWRRPYYCYVDMETNGAGWVRLWNFAGYAVDVDVHSGKLRNIQETR